MNTPDAEIAANINSHLGNSFPLYNIVKTIANRAPIAIPTPIQLSTYF